MVRSTPTPQVQHSEVPSDSQSHRSSQESHGSLARERFLQWYQCMATRVSWVVYLLAGLSLIRVVSLAMGAWMPEPVASSLEQLGYWVEFPFKSLVGVCPQVLENPWLPPFKFASWSHHEQVLHPLGLGVALSLMGIGFWVRYRSPERVQQLYTLWEEYQSYCQNKAVLSEQLFAQEALYREAMIELNNEKDVLQLTVFLDELTQVYNKKFFLESLDNLFNEQERVKDHFGLTMFDLDYFKKINDTYGHIVGDHVLQGVAQAIQRIAGGKGYCCRFGGEEFCLLMPGLEFKESLEVLQRVHAEVAKLRFDEAPGLRVTL
ncbi:MAG: GGDEF domain-containing protein, partial [Vampirovibrionales bacterium]